jgi:hypothetical protein
MDLTSTTQTYISLSPAMILMHTTEPDRFVALRDLLADHSDALSELLFGDQTAETLNRLKLAHGLALKQAQVLANLITSISLGESSPLGPDVRRAISAELSELPPEQVEAIATEFEQRFLQPVWKELEGLHLAGKRIVACQRCEAQKVVPCDACNATGNIEGLIFSKSCTQCEGTGKMACPDCNGKGAHWASV